MSDSRKKEYRLAAGLIAVSAMAAVTTSLYAARTPTPTPEVRSLVSVAQNEKEVVWNQPDDGLLGGRVTGQDDAGFVLEDAAGISWYVATTESTPGLEYAKFLERVRIVGEKGEDGYFLAKEIRPWEYRRE